MVILYMAKKKQKLEMLQAPRGTFDVLPENFGYYEKFLKAARPKN